MSTTEKNVLGSVATVMSTELNALASGSQAIGPAYNNTIGGNGDGYTRAFLQLNVTFGSAPSGTTGVTVWLISQSDGTNYEDGSASVTPTGPGTYFGVRAVTTLQRVKRIMSLPPGNFKVLLQNNSGVAFPVTGSTVSLLPFTPQGV